VILTRFSTNLRSKSFIFLNLSDVMNKRWKIQKGQSKSDYSEKSATQGTQDEEKQNKNKCLGHHYTQTNT
jgi:hypothetical protein